VSQIETHSCQLRLVAQGQIEQCLQERCSFWEPGGAVAQGACLIERLGVDIGRSDLATYLLEVRERLEHARDVAGRIAKTLPSDFCALELKRIHAEREWLARVDWR